MNRSDLVKTLMNEGFSEKTIVNFSDKQLKTLVERITMTADAYNKEKNNPSVQAIAQDPNASLQISEKLVGNQKKLDKNHNGKIDGQDFKIMQGQKKKSEVKEEGEKWIQKAIKPENKGKLHKALHAPQDEKIPASKLNAAAKKGGKIGKEARLAKTLKSLHETNEINEWVDSLVQKKYVPFTQKGKIMETIKTKIKETMQPMPEAKAKKGHNGIPEWLSYDSIVKTAEKVMDAPAPAKPAPATPTKEPGTKEPPKKNPVKDPFRRDNPQPRPERHPKAKINEKKW